MKKSNKQQHQQQQPFPNDQNQQTVSTTATVNDTNPSTNVNASQKNGTVLNNNPTTSAPPQQQTQSQAQQPSPTSFMSGTQSLFSGTSNTDATPQPLGTINLTSETPQTAHFIPPAVACVVGRTDFSEQSIVEDINDALFDTNVHNGDDGVITASSSTIDNPPPPPSAAGSISSNNMHHSSEYLHVMRQSPRPVLVGGSAMQREEGGIAVSTTDEGGKISTDYTSMSTVGMSSPVTGKKEFENKSMGSVGDGTGVGGDNPVSDGYVGGRVEWKPYSSVLVDPPTFEIFGGCESLGSGLNSGSGQALQYRKETLGVPML